MQRQEDVVENSENNNMTHSTVDAHLPRSEEKSETLEESHISVSSTDENSDYDDIPQENTRDEAFPQQNINDEIFPEKANPLQHPAALLAPVVGLEFRLRLVPFDFNITNINQPAYDGMLGWDFANIIYLKKDPNGLVKAYYFNQDKLMGPVMGLNLSSSELKAMAPDFPAQEDDEHYTINRNQFPELVDKIAMRCGLISNKTGTFSAALFSIGCGITTVAATIAALSAFAVAGPVAWVAAAFVGVCTATANWNMAKYDMPEIFQTGFSYLFKNKIREEDRDGNIAYVDAPISGRRKALLWAGMICATALGMGIATLTFTSTMGLPATFAFLSVATAWLPPVGMALAAVSFISLAVIMIKSMSDLVKSEDPAKSMSDAVYNIFRIDPQTDVGFMGKAKRVGAWLTLGALSLGGLALTFLGATFTQITCMQSLVDTLKLTAPAARNAFSFVIGSLSLIAQIPFTVITTLNPILQMFYRWEKPKPSVITHANDLAANDAVIDDMQPEQEQAPLIAQQQPAAVRRDPNDRQESHSTGFILGAVASIVNAGGNAFVALNGRKFNIATTNGVGTVGAFFTSVASTLGNTISNDIPEREEAPAPAGPRL